MTMACLAIAMGVKVSLVICSLTSLIVHPSPVASSNRSHSCNARMTTFLEQ